MSQVDDLRGSLVGDLFEPGSEGYEEARPARTAGFESARPRFIVLCRSEADVVAVVAYAAATGMRLVPRSGGHCLAGRSSTDGVLLDLSALNSITVDASGTAQIGAGARLGEVYRTLHAHGRSLPAGCGASVGVAGLTLGGGIGLLGRAFGLTCDRLLGARVVLASGRLVECDEGRESDLFWALRGAGGGQFGIVTALRFATVPEPEVVSIDAFWEETEVAELIGVWLDWAPAAPDGFTLNLSVERHPAESALRIQAFGVSTLPGRETASVLQEFLDEAPTPVDARLGARTPYSAVKETLADEARSSSVGAIRLRSEFFESTLQERTTSALLSRIGEPDLMGGDRTRRLTFTAMGGAYNRVRTDATAFAHRGTRFLLEHVGTPDDAWIDASWETAHADGSGRVYPNFPDPLLDDALLAYHAGNAARLAEVKQAYDPGRFFDFPQAIRPAPSTGALRSGIRRNEVPS